MVLEMTDLEPKDEGKSAKSLGGTLKRGATAAGVGLLVVQGVGIVQTLVLGRILGPGQVGLFAAGTVLLGFIAVVSQGAMSQALVQRRTDVDAAANTVLVVTFGTGILMAGAVAAASPVIGIVFHSDEVTLIALASAGMVLLHACTSVPDALMQRDLKVHRKLIIDPAATITYAAVAIGLAIAGMGAWAMVIGTYASQVVWIALSWTFARWKPSISKFSVHLWRDMSVFSFPLLVSAIAERTRETAEQVLVGQFLGTRALGQFRYGYRLGSMPSVAIIQICSYVLFPAFAQIAHDRERYVHAYRRAAGWLWAAALPVGFLMILAAEPVIVALLGTEWQPAGAAAAAMAGVGPGIALAAVATEAVKGAGQPRVLAWIAIASAVVGLPLVWWMTYYGLSAVGAAISAIYLMIGVLSILCATPVVSVPLSTVLRELLPVTISAVSAFAIVGGVRLLLAPREGIVGPIGECVLYVVLYLAALVVFDRPRAQVIVRIPRQLIGRLRSGR